MFLFLSDTLIHTDKCTSVINCPALCCFSFFHLLLVDRATYGVFCMKTSFLVCRQLTVSGSDRQRIHSKIVQSKEEKNAFENLLLLWVHSIENHLSNLSNRIRFDCFVSIEKQTFFGHKIKTSNRQIFVSTF